MLDACSRAHLKKRAGERMGLWGALPWPVLRLVVRARGFHAHVRTPAARVSFFPGGSHTTTATVWRTSMKQRRVGKGPGPLPPCFVLSPLPRPAAARAGGAGPAGSTGTALPVPCDKNLFPGPEKFFFPRLFLCWARPCGDLPPMGTPSASRSVFLKKVTDFIE